MPTLELKNVSYAYEKGKAVFNGRHVVDQIIALENQRDMVPAVVFQTFFRNILAVKQDATLCRHIQPAQQGSGEVAKQADVVLEIKRGHLKEREM